MSDDQSGGGDGSSRNKQRVWDDFGPEGSERPDDHDRQRMNVESDAPTKEDDDEALPPPPPVIPRTDSDSQNTAPPPSQADITDLQPLYRTRTREFYLLWFVAALAYGLGDTLTTGTVLVVPTISESNPLVGLVLHQFGLVGFVAVKLVVFAVLLPISVKGAIDDDGLSYYGPPLLAILLGTVLTLWNLVTILGV